MYIGYPGGSYYTKYLMIATALPMTLTNGLILTSGPKIYFGGNDASTIMTALTMSTSSPLKTGFVTSMTSSESWGTVPSKTTLVPTTTKVSQPMDFVVVDVATTTPTTTVTMPYIDLTGTISVTNMIVPADGTPTQCSTQYSVAGYPTTVNYYIGDTASLGPLTP